MVGGHLLGRPRIRWEESIKIDLSEVAFEEGGGFNCVALTLTALKQCQSLNDALSSVICILGSVMKRWGYLSDDLGKVSVESTE